MITEITRTLNGTYIYANTTIMFDSNPYLLANNNLTLYFTDNDARYAATVTSVSGNNAVVNFSNRQYANAHVTAITPNFGPGLTGPQETFSFTKSTPPTTLIQTTITGSSANVSLEVSSDNVGWVSLANIALTQTNNTDFISTIVPWPYGRLNITDIQSNTTLIATKVI